MAAAFRTRFCGWNFSFTILAAVAVTVTQWALAQSAAVVPATVRKVQVSDPVLVEQIVAAGGKLVANYSSFAIYETSLPPAQFADQSGIEIRDAFNLIQLNAGVLDTTKSQTQALRQPIGTFEGKRLHLIQFAGPILPKWYDQLLAVGVDVVTYIPENAYLVYGDAAALQRLQQFAASASHIQWEGAYLDDYKLDPSARLVDLNGNARTIGTTNFAIQLVADAVANRPTLGLLDRLKNAPILRQEEALGYLNVIVAISPADLPLIAARPEVVSIQPSFFPKKVGERQAKIVARNLIGSSPSGPDIWHGLPQKG